MAVAVINGLRVDLAPLGIDVVDDIDFTIDAGEILGVAGESGSGKTTVGMALLGDARRGARIVRGSVTLDGDEVVGVPHAQLAAVRGSTVAYVPQDPSMALNPGLRISKQLGELFDYHQPSLRPPERHERVRGVLDEVGLPSNDSFLARYPHQLSGGQQQRVTLAMAFILRPRVIVLDEPTTGLDVTTQARILRTVRDLCDSHHVAALYVTHDMAVLANLAHRVLVMYAGRIVEVGKSEQIFRRPAHPYTRALISAVPLVSERRELVGIPGETPAPGSRPSGCPFHSRCPDAVPDCTTIVPEPIEVAPGHTARCIRVHELSGRSTIAPELAASITTLDRDSPVLGVSHVNAFHGKRQILNDVSLQIFPRECLALVGESGSGKTTLARCIVGLHRRYTGQISFRGEALRGRARDRKLTERKAIQYIFQNPYNSLNPRRSIGETLSEPLRFLFGQRGTVTRTKVNEVLERVSLSPKMASYRPAQLSGGERQRVAIARALICQPDVLVCDEITSALDVSVQASIIQLLRQLQDEDGLALLFVTHNLALVRSIGDRVIAMRSGELVEEGPIDEVLDHPKHPYTMTLLNDTPTLGAKPQSGPKAAPPKPV